MKTLALFSALLMMLGCQAVAPTGQPYQIQHKKPKNVILLIGDGMGLTQVSSAFYFGEGEPNFTRFTHTGLSRTSSSSHKITDSAAGATAFSCGVKTYNGAVGMDQNKKPVETIVERVAKKGLKTGLIATSSITHATPASFYAHAESREEHEKIAAQLLKNPVDFFAGSGQQYFMKRKDEKNLLKALEDAGFALDTAAWSQPEKLEADKKYGFLIGQKSMPRMLDGRGDFLPEATQTALAHLGSHETGFFLMVEGSQIDWGGHARDAEYITTEVLDFDKAIGAALDFAEKDGNTLVIVTADHETGGFALSPKLVRMQWDYDLVDGQFYNGADKVPSAGHTAAMVPVFAFGPGAEAFTGIYQNNEIFHKIVAAAGW